MSAITDTGPDALEPLRGDDAHRVVYQFTCEGSSTELVVTGFHGVEELNAPYHLTVHLQTADDTADTSACLGRETTLTLERNDAHRLFHGIVSRVTILGKPMAVRKQTRAIPRTRSGAVRPPAALALRSRRPSDPSAE